MGKKSDVSLQTLAEFIRDLVYDDFSRNLRWSLSVIHPKTDDGDVGFSGGIWTDYQKAKNQMSISFGFSDTKGIYNFKAWINSSEIRFSFGENPTFEDFKKTAERIFIDEEFCIKTKTPYERTRDVCSLDLNLGCLITRKRRSDSMEDHCVACGEVIPEGRQVCPICNREYIKYI